MHKAIWEDRITLDKKKNEIVRIVNARSNQKIIPGLKKGEQTNFDCYKQYETSPDVCRNLYRNFYNFLGVEFPKEKVWDYKNKRYVKRGYDNWDETCCNVNFNTHFLLTEREKKIICNKYPNFKYVLNKWQGTKAQTMAVLKEWKIHPEIELPLSLGYYDICFSKTFHEMNKEDLKKCFKFMNENRELNLSITDLKIVVKHGAEVAEMYSRAKTITGKRVKMNEIKWIVTQYDTYYKGISYFDFRHDLHEYYDLCKYFEKDMKDEYWAHPKYLKERVIELRTQRNNIRILEETERLKQKMTRYNNVIKRFEGWDKTVDGYNIIIPKTVEQWQKQASVLHQCIIRMNYMDEVNKNYVLFFILKGDTPIATCEVTNLMEKKIGQFYADEQDRSNCLPTPEVRNAMLKYLDELKVA
jgi:hypothetical protein